MPSDHENFWAEVARGERVESDKKIRVRVRVKSGAQFKKRGKTYDAGKVLSLCDTRAVLWECIDRGTIENPWPDRKK